MRRHAENIWRLVIFRTSLYFELVSWSKGQIFTILSSDLFPWASTNRGDLDVVIHHHKYINEAISMIKPASLLDSLYQRRIAAFIIILVISSYKSRSISLILILRHFSSVNHVILESQSVFALPCSNILIGGIETRHRWSLLSVSKKPEHRHRP